MPTNIAEAISAYRNMQRESGLGGLSARDAQPGDSFAEALRTDGGERQPKPV